MKNFRKYFFAILLTVVFSASTLGVSVQAQTQDTTQAQVEQMASLVSILSDAVRGLANQVQNFLSRQTTPVHAAMFSSFNASPNYIQSGGPVTLFWKVVQDTASESVTGYITYDCGPLGNAVNDSSGNPVSCGTNISMYSLNGSVTVYITNPTSITQAITFHAFANNAESSFGPVSVTVAAGAAPQPTPSINSFSIQGGGQGPASSITVPVGTSVTLNWSASGVSSCSSSGDLGYFPSLSTQGPSSALTLNTAGTFTQTLTCGGVSKPVSVTVTPLPVVASMPTASLTSPQANLTVDSGSSITLNASGANYTRSNLSFNNCNVSIPNFSCNTNYSASAQNTFNVTNNSGANQSVVFTLYAYNAANDVSTPSQVYVTVRGVTTSSGTTPTPAGAPTLSLASIPTSPSSFPRGQGTTLNFGSYSSYTTHFIVQVSGSNWVDLFGAPTSQFIAASYFPTAGPYTIQAQGCNSAGTCSTPVSTIVTVTEPATNTPTSASLGGFTLNIHQLPHGGGNITGTFVNPANYSHLEYLIKNSSGALVAGPYGADSATPQTTLNGTPRSLSSSVNLPDGTYTIYGAACDSSWNCGAEYTWKSDTVTLMPIFNANTGTTGGTGTTATSAPTLDGLTINTGNSTNPSSLTQNVYGTPVNISINFTNPQNFTRLDLIGPGSATWFPVYTQNPYILASAGLSPGTYYIQGRACNNAEQCSATRVATLTVNPPVSTPNTNTTVASPTFTGFTVNGGAYTTVNSGGTANLGVTYTGSISSATFACNPDNAWITVEYNSSSLCAPANNPQTNISAAVFNPTASVTLRSNAPDQRYVIVTITARDTNNNVIGAPRSVTIYVNRPTVATNPAATSQTQLGTDETRVARVSRMAIAGPLDPDISAANLTPDQRAQVQQCLISVGEISRDRLNQYSSSTILEFRGHLEANHYSSDGFLNPTFDAIRAFQRDYLRNDLIARGLDPQGTGIVGNLTIQRMLQFDVCRRAAGAPAIGAPQPTPYYPGSTGSGGEGSQGGGVSGGGSGQGGTMGGEGSSNASALRVSRITSRFSQTLDDLNDIDSSARPNVIRAVQECFVRNNVRGGPYIDIAQLTPQQINDYTGKLDGPDTGNPTRSAIKQFQSDHNLPMTGRLGPAGDPTREQIRQFCFSGQTSETPSNAPTAATSTITVLSPNGGEQFVQGFSNLISWQGGRGIAQIGLVNPDYPLESNRSLLGWISGLGESGTSMVWDGRGVTDLAQTVVWPVSPGRYKILAVSKNASGNSCADPNQTGDRNPCNFDLSDAPFSIVAPGATGGGNNPPPNNQ